MKAFVYLGPGKYDLQDRAKPEITAPTDAIVKLTKTTICGTDLHILKGDVPTCQPGRILGHEGVGTIEQTGAAVAAFKPGDRVLISCISACGKCEYCRRLMYSHCTTGGWILGNSIDGTQAEYVRIPHADTSLYPIPQGADEEALVMLSDILPTGFECGVLNGRVAPGGSVAIVGAGPIGLAALLTAQFYSPAEIIMIDLDDNRLQVAKRFGATATINSSDGKAVEALMQLTGGRGVDTAIEAVGIAATFELCEKILAPGGVLANVGGQRQQALSSALAANAQLRLVPVNVVQCQPDDLAGAQSEARQKQQHSTITSADRCEPVAAVNGTLCVLCSDRLGNRWSGRPRGDGRYAGGEPGGNLAAELAEAEERPQRYGNTLHGRGSHALRFLSNKRNRIARAKVMQADLGLSEAPNQELPCQPGVGVNGGRRQPVVAL